MLSKVLAVTLFWTIPLFAQVQSGSTVDAGTTVSTDGDDLAIVRVILDKCGLTNLAVGDVSVVENGRVVALDLTNKDVAKDGLSALPAEIGNLTNLRSFICNNNIITELPEEIGKLVELQTLLLRSNRLTTLPRSIRNCVNIVDLDLRHNQMESVPAEIGNLQKLTRLWLWGNKLTTLSDAIVSVKSLREIYLKDNRLTTLPAGITKMNLIYFDVIGNKICKPDPALLAWLTKWEKRFRETQKCW